LGVTGQSLNSENAKELGINKTEGFYVNETDPEMGAHIAGMRNGDIILQIDDVQINKFSDLSGYLNAKRPGDNLEVTIDRNGKKIILDVLLKVSTYVQFYGMQLKNSNKDELDNLDIENGVTVVVNRNSTLYRMGVRSGYILTEINDKTISSTTQLKSFEKENIYQISFIDLDGNKERLIFD
jgi:S1-C subfamily serine protease